MLEQFEDFGGQTIGPRQSKCRKRPNYFNDFVFRSWCKNRKSGLQFVKNLVK